MYIYNVYKLYIIIVIITKIRSLVYLVSLMYQRVKEDVHERTLSGVLKDTV